MVTDRVSIVQRRLESLLEDHPDPPALHPPEAPLGSETTLTGATALQIFEDQLLSRAVDVEARRLQSLGLGYYTISSAGHEQNALLGTLLRTTDPSFLHYRSGAFMMARSRKDPGVDGVRDTLLSLCASQADPIARGRHKVWGSRALWVPPQTSTIASHLPKAVGMAFALGRAPRLDWVPPIPADSVVCCTFGDASANHATALSGISSARYGSRRGNPIPILFVCEDNGIGISTETPPRWIRDTFSQLSWLTYMEAEGSLDQIWNAVEEAVNRCRESRAPVFLRVSTVRLWGHAGSDIEMAYRSREEIEAAEARDPLLLNARFLMERGIASPKTLRDLSERVRQRVREASADAVQEGHLDSAERVMAPLAPYDEERVRTSASGTPDPERRARLWGDEPPESATVAVKRTLAAHLSAGLADEMLRRPEILVFGEDVGRKGGVYYVTAGLQKRHGSARVIDTQLDETTILGLAQGAGMVGLLPIPEIQYLAYVHNAVDQLRGEASSLQFFSDGQFANPMVVRIASFAYQKGFGGHFHNDNSIGGLRDIPGLVLAAPARGDDAVRMLRGCVALARECGRVVAFLEPIALYHERDLFAPGDDGWLTDYPRPGEALLPGEVGLYPPDDAEGRPEILVVSYANGLRMSLQARERLRSNDSPLALRILDLRWLNPLPFEALRTAAAGAAAVVVVDECRATGAGIADAIVADLAETGYGRPLRSVRARDSFVPLGPAADHVLVQVEDVVETVRALEPLLV
ncbi:MAG: thiamine pyrophosphate-dependent enzyme [Gemmatimonadota bacterium]